MKRLAVVVLLTLTLSSPAGAAPRGLARVRDALVNLGGRTVGYLEMAGLRYPVKPYQAQVSDALRRGSRLEGDGLRRLQASGTRAVISLTAEHSDHHKEVSALGMNYLRLRIIDNTSPSKKQMLRFLAFMERPENQPAYVHCEAGKGRTGVAVAVYRMAMQGWSFDAALTEARSYGLSMPNQVDFLRKFGRDLEKGRIPGYPRATPLS